LEKDDDDDKQQKADAVYAYTTSVCFVDDGWDERIDLLWSLLFITHEVINFHRDK
jgi:hypothetical protein